MLLVPYIEWNLRNETWTNAVYTDIVFGILALVLVYMLEVRWNERFTSMASLFVMEMTAALDAQYGAELVSGFNCLLHRERHIPAFGLDTIPS